MTNDTTQEEVQDGLNNVENTHARWCEAVFVFTCWLLLLRRWLIRDERRALCREAWRCFLCRGGCKKSNEKIDESTWFPNGRVKRKHRLEKRGRTVRGVAYTSGMRYDWPIRLAWTNGKCCIITCSPEVVDGQLAFWFVFDFFLFIPYMSLAEWWNFIIDISGATLPVSETNIHQVCVQ